MPALSAGGGGRSTGRWTSRTQMTLLLEGRKPTERGQRWLVHNRRPAFEIASPPSAYFADGVRTVRASLPKLLA